VVVVLAAVAVYYVFERLPEPATAPAEPAD
jgi:hypothetical protein